MVGLPHCIEGWVWGGLSNGNSEDWRSVRVCGGRMIQAEFERLKFGLGEW